MSNQVNSMNKGLTVKDIVTTGIFTALLFVFVLVGGVFFATNPVLTFFMPPRASRLDRLLYERAGHHQQQVPAPPRDGAGARGDSRDLRGI